MTNYGAHQRKNWRNRLYYFHHAVEINPTYIMTEPFEKALLRFSEEKVCWNQQGAWNAGSMYSAPGYFGFYHRMWLFHLHTMAKV